MDNQIIGYPLVTVNHDRAKDTMSDQLLPSRIKKARENLGITMAEAARRLNLSKIGYCRYEYGERVPSPQTIEVIARCFGTSVNYLMGKCDDMSPDYVIVSKGGTPLLFELTSGLSNSSTSVQKRVLEYYKKLNDHS